MHGSRSTQDSMPYQDYEVSVNIQSLNRCIMNILFVCVGNSCRSQMAEGIARSMGMNAASAGTHPAEEMATHARTILQELGIDTEGMRPKSIDDIDIDAFEYRISMGCGVSCPAIRLDADWGLDDPVGQELEVYRQTAEQITELLISFQSSIEGAGTSP